MFGRTIVGVDGSSGGRDAIALARQLVGPDGKLTLAHVVAWGGSYRAPHTRPVSERSLRSKTAPRSCFAPPATKPALPPTDRPSRPR